MSIEDLSNKIDPEKMNELIAYLLMVNVVETRTLVKFLMDMISKADAKVLDSNISKLEGYQKEKFTILKDRLYEKFGWLPPNFLEDEI